MAARRYTLARRPALNHRVVDDGSTGPAPATPTGMDALLPVIVGNVIGGSLLVGATYWFVYLRRRD